MKPIAMHMKNRFITSLLLLSLLFLTGSCREQVHNHDLWLENAQDLSMTFKHRPLLEYQPDRWQKGFSRNEFWITKDDMNEFFHICLDKAPIVGNKVSGNLDFRLRGEDIQHKKNLRFDTMKMDENGKIWLYNNSKDIGLVIGPME